MVVILRCERFSRNMLEQRGLDSTYGIYRRSPANTIVVTRFRLVVWRDNDRAHSSCVARWLRSFMTNAAKILGPGSLPEL